MTRSIAAILLAVSCGAALAVAQADVSGSWTFEIENPQGSTTRSMDLEQDGNALTGTTTGDTGSTADVSGTVDGNAVELTYEVPALGGLAVTMTGTVDGSTMSGTMDFGGQGAGSFTARKDE